MAILTAAYLVLVGRLLFLMREVCSCPSPRSPHHPQSIHSSHLHTSTSIHHQACPLRPSTSYQPSPCVINLLTLPTSTYKLPPYIITIDRYFIHFKARHFKTSTYCPRHHFILFHIQAIKAHQPRDLHIIRAQILVALCISESIKHPYHVCPCIFYVVYHQQTLSHPHQRIILIQASCKYDVSHFILANIIIFVYASSTSTRQLW